jgi:uncharacterized protein (TIGR02145 family)
MKRIILLFLLLHGIVAAAQNPVVKVRAVGATYGASPEVTFEVAWAAAPDGIHHLPDVWLFIDYRVVEAGSATGPWLPASITAVAPPSAGTLSFPVPLPGRGFYLAGNPAGAFAATLTVALDVPQNKRFNWCVYASDYPPNAIENDGFYTLRGSPPFTVGGQTLPAGVRTVSGCIASLSDATGCPGLLPVRPAVTSFTTSAASVCPGQSVTLMATADSAVAYSFDGGLSWQPEASAVVTPLQTTTCSVHVKNRGGCTATSTSSVTVSVFSARSAGAIVSGTATTAANLAPGETVQSSAAATGGNAVVYQWRRSGTSSATLTGTGATYRLDADPSNYAAAGTYYFHRYAKDDCHAEWALSDGVFTLEINTVNPPQGSCTFTQPPVVNTFAGFQNSYSGSTYVSLTDERDNKNYAAVKIGGRWIMAQNLNYQEGLTYFDRHTAPNTATGSNPDLRSGFWCPSNDAGAIDRAVCDYWGALYSWETAMMLDGKGEWKNNINVICTGAATNTNCATNNGRTSAAGTDIGGRGICPPNWHVPTSREWAVLLDAMNGGGNTYQNNASQAYTGSAGKHAKVACTGTEADNNPAWQTGNTNIDTYNFRAFPSGSRNSNGAQQSNRGKVARFWASSIATAEAWMIAFTYSNDGAVRFDEPVSFGSGIRCIRDL